MSSKKEFFKVAPVSDVLNILYEHCAPLSDFNTLATHTALGFRLAVDLTSPIDLPSFRRSTMDGFAVKAANTFGASDTLPVYLTQVGTIHMGVEPTLTLEDNQAVEIHTGAMVPTGADAVVMVERTQRINETEIEILNPVSPGENVLQIGEDVTAGDLILPAGHRLRPQDIGGLLAVGITEVQVVRRPKVAILSCGDELIPAEEIPNISQIRDINGPMLATLLTELGAEIIPLGIAIDTFDDLYTKAQTGLEQADMLVMSAGSSVSVRDLTSEVIEKLGEPGILQHGLAVKPGKPTIAAVCNGKPVIGLPGNPVSAMSVARQLVLPVIRYLMHEAMPVVGTVQAELTSNIASTTGREDTVAVRLQQTSEGWLAEPVFGKSNLIYTLIHADGYVHIPLNSNGLKAGTLINILLF